MAKIFISYSRKDSALVRQIERALYWAGHDVWIDVNNERIDSLWKLIEPEMDNADAIVVCHSRHTRGSKWPERELEKAHKLRHVQGKSVLHVRVDPDADIIDGEVNIEFFPEGERKRAIRRILKQLGAVPLHSRRHLWRLVGITWGFGVLLFGIGFLISQYNACSSAGGALHAGESDAGAPVRPEGGRILLSTDQVKVSTRSASNPLPGLLDGDPMTAWCTGSGAGRGAQIDVAVPAGVTPTQIKIYGGWDYPSPRAGDMWTQAQIARRIKVEPDVGRPTELSFSRASDRGKSKAVRLDPASRKIRIIILEVESGPIQVVCMPEVELQGVR